ncbi:TPA: hypothetical protein N0F65_002876 [Lagenidium giganteum]|uniref:Uncharacterized protein n=1 Tax=Lagenidium giganteum TaxID=4803 RepID=A0AAV2ZEA7_9STRA|nr:TPA: hypothetical protein N0F65_002876 [Lagenidium giganteum]
MTASPRAHALGLLVAGVALIDVGAQYQRRYQAGKRTSHLVLSCSLLAVGQVAEFVAVSLLPLTLSAVAVSGMAAIVQCTARARDPVAQLQKQWWLLLTVFTGFLIIAASVDGSDRMTPDEMKQQLSSKSALLFLLLNVIVMLGLLFWISETNYAFQVEPQPTDPTGYTCRAQFHVRQLFRQTLLSPFAIQEMNIRSKTFGVLAGLAGATALLFEKCAGEMVRYAVRSPPSVTSNAITMVALAMAVWSIFAAFQAKWVSIGLNETLTPSIVYKPYLFMLSLCPHRWLPVMATYSLAPPTISIGSRRPSGSQCLWHQFCLLITTPSAVCFLVKPRWWRICYHQPNQASKTKSSKARRMNPHTDHRHL